MDESIRIVWYDLKDEDRDDYLNWLHGTYLPEVLSRPGILWTAHYKIIKTDEMVKKLSTVVGRPPDMDEIPQGSEYAMMVGAGSPHVFFQPNFDKIDETSPETQKMLALQQGRRKVVTTGQARVNGPALDQRAPSSTPAPFIQLGHFRVRSVEEEFDLIDWYADYRLPAIARMEGAVAARKLVTVAGWVKHVILYEFVSAQAHHDNFMGHESLAFTDGEWTNKVVNYTAHAPGSPSIGERIWPEV